MENIELEPNLYLKSTIKEFQETINNMVAEGTLLEKMSVAEDESALSSYKVEIKAWCDKVLEYLRQSFNIENNYFYRNFGSAHGDCGSYNFGRQRSIAEIIADQKANVKQKNFTLCRSTFNRCVR